MDQSNPYASPRSDLTRPAPTAVDTTNPFDPSGRFTRLSWLAWNLVLAVAGVVVVGALAALGLVALPQSQAQAANFLPLALLIPQIVLMVFGWLLTIRRFHDIDASGWWSLTLLVPLVNLITALVLLFKRGDEAANRFGPPRPTADWERVLGIIYIVLIVLGFIGVIAAIAIPAFLGYQTHAMH